MANTQYTHSVGHVGFQRQSAHPQDETVPASDTKARKSFGKYTNLVGAVLSVSLVAGVGVWGYKLVMRDVTGIPVVRAAAGEMRGLPEDPGGQVALHQGLAVNEVAAVGQASGPVDRLVLAPRPMDLSAEDQPIAAQTAAQTQQSVLEETEQAALPEQATDPLGQGVVQPQSNDIDAIVASLTQGANPIAPVAPRAAAEPAVIAVTDVPVAQPAVYQGSGLKLSKRPQIRPIKVAVQPSAVTQVAAVINDVSSIEVDAATLPAGTRLVQLGALDTPEKARAHWDKLNARFGDYLQGKQRVVIKATSGERAFYRLRAVGFTDLADARRFCSALVADGADCIPVVTR